ncbi:MAG: hypothetical protein QXM08_03165 [Thermofilaceae archaeon]
MSVKTSFVLPRELYAELKKRAVEEGRSVREVLIDAILLYLTSARGGERLLYLLLKPVEGAGPEDYSEYGYEDVGGCAWGLWSTSSSGF